MSLIFHVLTPSSWAEAKSRGAYRAPSLETEGFIHCSKPEQVAGVVERYYRDVPNLLVLEIDEARVTSPMKYEPATGRTEIFPHIYGPLNLDAVLRATPLEKWKVT